MPLQKRLKKYSRETPENLPNRQITNRSIEIIDVLNRYKFLPTSLIVRLIKGNRRITKRHLQNLYHTGYVNRFAFPTSFHPGEFNYFLDNKKALDLLKEKGFLRDELDYRTVLNNRHKQYDEIAFNRELVQKQGRLSHLNHELMISRFHFMLEMACRRSNGKAELKEFVQGTRLWNTVEVPRLKRDTQGNWRKSEKKETLPHRPDAFFAIRFPEIKEEENTHYFFYEADRATMNIAKMKQKFRSHFHFVVKEKKHREHYKINRIKGILIESINSRWANHLRMSARHRIVSGNKPSPLFWFTTSQVFEREVDGRKLYLERPEIIFNRIWATPEQGDEIKEGKFLSLIPNGL